MTTAASGNHQQLHHHVSHIILVCLIRVPLSLLTEGAELGRRENGGVLGWGGWKRAAHPIQHVGPALHGDALKHRQHGKQEVVEVGDAPVGSLPAFSALAAIDGALAPMP